MELPEYRRILLATDGSEQAQEAVRQALALARQLGAALDVLFVVDLPLTFSLGIHRVEAVHELEQDGRQALGRVAEQAKQVGVQVETHLGEGRPAEVICHDAQRLQADLIVMGSHGQGALGDILLGSVSQYVVHHASVPVCVVRPAQS